MQKTNHIFRIVKKHRINNLKITIVSILEKLQLA
jgi:hypothetical protein